MFPIASKTWFANKLTIQHTFSSKIRKNYIKYKVNRVIYPANFITKHAAIYSKQFIYSDNTYIKIELYRLDQSKIEATKLTRHLNKTNLTTINFEDLFHREFILRK